jgi:hypothetical protein
MEGYHGLRAQSTQMSDCIGVSIEKCQHPHKKQEDTKLVLILALMKEAYLDLPVVGCIVVHLSCFGAVSCSLISLPR